MTSIGERIRAARELQGLSQPAVAREAGCSLATYKRYEKIEEETPPPGFQYLHKIAALLRLDLRVDGENLADPDNPRLSEASELQLAQELARRLAERAAVEASRASADEDTPGRPIEVRGMPVSTDRDTDHDRPG